MTRTRVLVVDDSATVRHHLCAVVEAAPELELVGSAEDGKRAIELVLALRPDVISMDMMMPVMTGVATTEYLMAHCPTPILVVSSSTNRGELFRTYDALQAGAVDVLEKPRGDEPPGVWEASYVAALRMVARIRVITHLRARLRPVELVVERKPPEARELVVIGASTGGPGALVEVMRSLPDPLPVPVLFVLHINEPFGAAFADWLDRQTHVPVAMAQHGEPITNGRMLMAPPGRHMIVDGRRVQLTDDAERHSCRPSVDVLFESVARVYRGSAVACLLTGMGRDGATGMRAIRDAGGFTIAQDEASSIVFGMPREAIALGGADRVLPLGDIGSEVTMQLRARKETR